MSRNKILHQPTRVGDLSFDDLYGDISRDWQNRAEKLRARRWRKLKHQLI